MKDFILIQKLNPKIKDELQKQFLEENNKNAIQKQNDFFSNDNLYH